MKRRFFLIFFLISILISKLSSHKNHIKIFQKIHLIVQVDVIHVVARTVASLLLRFVEVAHLTAK